MFADQQRAILLLRLAELHMFNPCSKETYYLYTGFTFKVHQALNSNGSVFMDDSKLGDRANKFFSWVKRKSWLLKAYLGVCELEHDGAILVLLGFAVLISFHRILNDRVTSKRNCHVRSWVQNNLLIVFGNKSLKFN